jgi:uncharacterized protein YfeS
VQCEERERLTRAYIEAAAKILESGRGAPDMTSAQWKQATSQARAASKAALEALHRHRKEHGCWEQGSPEA